MFWFQSLLSESADNNLMLWRHLNGSTSGEGRNYGGTCKEVLHAYLRIDSLEEWWSSLACSLEKFLGLWLMFVRLKRGLTSCEDCVHRCKHSQYHTQEHRPEVMDGTLYHASHGPHHPWRVCSPGVQFTTKFLVLLTLGTLESPLICKEINRS